MVNHVMLRAALPFFWSVIVFGQSQPSVPEPTNIDFSKGEIGQMPPGWNMPEAVLAAGYHAEWQQQDCGRFPTCVQYVSPSVIKDVRAAELLQVFPAESYIGKTVRFSAWVRMMNQSDGGYIHIRMRVYYANGQSELRDSVDPPVTTSQWQRREVHAAVKKGAVSIAIWARYVPSGSAWIASPAFETVEGKVPVVNSFGLAAAPFPVADAAGKNVRFSAWIKTENVANGYAGLWWRVDGDHGEQLALDNSFARLIDERPVSGSAVGRGATGSSGWKWYSIELPVAMGAKDIAFGLLLTGTGTAWFDSLAVELNDTPYTNPQFDFDFESPTPKGFPYTGDNRRSGRYRVGLDSTVAMTGRQSLKMQFIGDPAQPDSAPVHTPILPVVNPVVIDHSKSLEYSTPVVITFSNRSSTAVDIYWIDYSGVRKLKKSSLAVGESWRTSTFVTHPWLVVASGTGGAEQRDTGLRLAGFQASDSGGEAIVTDRK